MAASLDRFCEATISFEELKVEIAFKLHTKNRPMELKMFKLT